jgi:hypothetical protein
MVMLNPVTVAVSFVGEPESVTVIEMLLKVPVQEAFGARPEVVVSTPALLRVRHAGRPVALHV